MDDWYSEAEQRAIETAGQRCADTMRRLRGYDTEPDFPIDPWPASSARGPEYPTTEGAT